MRSDNVTKGSERAPNRSLFYALGYTPEELDRPLIGVVSAYSEIVPGHMNLDKIADAVKAGVQMAGGTPILIPAIGVCDGIAMGHVGMKYSLASRELICDSVETMLMAHQLDGLVLVPNCDKIVPGMVMAAVRMDVPAVVCSGGPMLAGTYGGEEVSLSKMFEAVGAYKAGMITDEQWETATNALVKALNALGKEYEINEGDGAFYGPKIDFHLEDSIGRTWQCGTIQLDFQMPERFDLTYVGQDGEKHRPVMIHRVVFGSIERFIAILTEHYAGAFPLWLSPVQVELVPITENQSAYAHEVCDKLVAAGIRAEVDDRNEKMGYRIREAQLQKIPYMLVLGEKERENGTVSVRNRKKGDIGSMSVDELVAKLTKEIDEKSSDM